VYTVQEKHKDQGKHLKNLTA